MNRTRLIAALLAAANVGYEVYTLKQQARTRETDHPVNNTWSEINRDLLQVDKLVGKALFEILLDGAHTWYKRHILEGSSSAGLHRSEGQHA